MSNRIEKFSAYRVNQIAAAADALRALKELPIVNADPSLLAVKETDIFHLRRGLCLPSAAATCINVVAGKRLIGENHSDARITIGDLFRILLPFHNKVNLAGEDGDFYPKPWFVVSDTGHVYHQAIIAIAKGVGINAKALTGISDIYDLLPFLQTGGTVAFSVDNHFVLDQTLHNDPNLVRRTDEGDDICVEDETGERFTRFEDGRHVLSLLGMDGNALIVHDSFKLPQMREDEPFMSLPPEIINPYLHYSQGGNTRGIAFSTEPTSFESLRPFHNDRIFIPKDVVDSVRVMLP